MTGRLVKWAYEHGEHGYYVVNSETSIIVSGPHPHKQDAEWEAARRNRIEPVTPNLLVVRELPRPVGAM